MGHGLDKRLAEIAHEMSNEVGSIYWQPVSAFYGWPDRPEGGVLNPTTTCSHEHIDNGTCVSECRHCRKRMVFEFPEWRVQE